MWAMMLKLRVWLIILRFENGRLDLAPAPGVVSPPQYPGSKGIEPCCSSGPIQPQNFPPWGSDGLDSGGELFMYPNRARKSIRVTTGVFPLL